MPSRFLEIEFPMHRQFLRIVAMFLIAIQSVTAWSQDEAKKDFFTDGPDQPTRFKLRVPETDIAVYEAELRYRMYLQMIGFLVLLGVLHLVQVKLKIHRGYFWFMVGGVIFLCMLNSYRPKIDLNKPRPTSDEPPTYAPTHAR